MKKSENNFSNSKLRKISKKSMTMCQIPSSLAHCMLNVLT